MNHFLLATLVFAPPLLIAVILHEIAHGYVAWKLGDPTAKSRGRITLNPLKHIDPFMTVILPGLLILSGSPFIFGGAKPVPIDPRYFKNPRKGMVLVAIAGPAVNIVIAAAIVIILQIFEKSNILNHLPAFLQIFYLLLLLPWLVYGFVINLGLALFNLIPVPPLDGGRIAVGLLPTPLAIRLAKLERYGLLIVFGLLYFGFVNTLLSPIITFAQHFLPQ